MVDEIVRNQKKELIWELLTSRRYYSRKVSTLSRVFDLSVPELRRICYELQEENREQINFFEFEEVAYVGTETGRLRYELDKKLGINLFENKK